MHENLGWFFLVLVATPGLYLTWVLLYKGPWSTLVSDYPRKGKVVVLSKDSSTLTTWVIRGKNRVAINNIGYGKTTDALLVSMIFPLRGAIVPIEEIVDEGATKICFFTRYVIGFKNSEAKLAEQNKVTK